MGDTDWDYLEGKSAAGWKANQGDRRLRKREGSSK